MLSVRLLQAKKNRQWAGGSWEALGIRESVRVPPTHRPPPGPVLIKVKIELRTVTHGPGIPQPRGEPQASREARRKRVRLRGAGVSAPERAQQVRKLSLAVGELRQILRARGRGRIGRLLPQPLAGGGFCRARGLRGRCGPTRARWGARRAGRSSDAGLFTRSLHDPSLLLRDRLHCAASDGVARKPSPTGGGWLQRSWG